MSPRPRPDFVQVRLAAAGRAAAGEAPLRIHTARMRYTFEGDQPLEVLKHAEWSVLRNECNTAGEPIFELVEGES